MSGQVRTFLLLAAATLCVGVLAGSALGGNKKKTVVVVESTSVLTGKQNVKVIGHLNSSSGCLPVRSMKLFQTDANGVVTQTLDSAVSDVGGNWKLQGKLPNPPTGDEFLQVKVKKLAVGKFVCKAGVSPLITIK